MNIANNSNICSKFTRVLLCICMMLGSTLAFAAKQKQAVQKASTHTLYLKYHFDIEKRNPTLFLVPSLYTIAKGNRHYFGEIYGTIHNDTLGKSHINDLIKVSTIGSNSKTMPVMLDYINPKLYNKTIFGDKILSPFHRSNQKLYKFRHGMTINNIYTLYIRPRTRNTQLVSGSAQIDARTGKIIKCSLHGEYDMLDYDVKCEMNTNDNTPKTCHAKSTFVFFGNKITTRFDAQYGDEVIELPQKTTRLEQMAAVRPDTLTSEELQMYNERWARKDSVQPSDTTQNSNNKKLQKRIWNIFDNYLIGSIRARGKHSEVKLSPLIDITQFSYSNSRGLSYKIKLSARHYFDENRAIMFTPRLGYNFKLNRLFTQVPLRWQIHSRHNQWLQLKYESGNRISHSSVLDDIQEEQGDSIDYSDMNLQYFYDHSTSFEANTNIGKCIVLNVGLVYHRRVSANKSLMAALGKETEYKTFAPSVTLQFDPLPRGPVLTINYERSIKDVLKSNTEYERWEGDISYNKMLNAGRQYNLRLGGGLYTNRSSNHFVYYQHFRDNYLNDSWNDDWTGRFQLVSSQWYNASDYYIKANAAYESPLMLAAWMPLVGKYMETERLYLNMLRIQHTRFYTEFGYGFTTRFVSIGLFAGMLNGSINEVGAKFELELFRKW